MKKKKQKKIVSLLLALAMLVSSVTVSAFTAIAATGGSQVYFDNSSYNWEQVYVYTYGTVENAEWPGELMELDEATGFYTSEFPSTYKSESIIFNNGLEEDEGKEQYPENAGLSLAAGECKLLTAENQWVDYGKPDDHGYGFAYTASGTAFSTENISVKLGLKNAETGFYSIDGSESKEFTDGTVITVGDGKIADTSITLVLTATGDDGVATQQIYTYKKTFTASQTTFSSPSDGHTTESESGYYSTNPNMQLGQYKTITVDGDPSDWDSSMIIAQGIANDDPRVYMPSSMHEQPWDDYALYCAWDDDNLYFMWEMANTTYITSPSDDFAASNEARPWRNSIPMYLALSIDPDKHATGKAIGTSLDGSTYTNPYVWGCDGGVAANGGVGFTTNVDTLIAFDSNNSNGGASVFYADVQDTDGSWLFNYDTKTPIGVTSYEKQDNQNGFQIKYANGTLSDTLYGVNGAKGSRTLGDNTDSNSEWVDFFDLGYKDSYDFIYEVAVPLSVLGIDSTYIEENGIGVMQILTYGTSGMDTLPHDPSMLDNADVEYSYDPSTSHEKEDDDDITVPLARVGQLLSDTVINYAPLEVNFGADRNSGQALNATLSLVAEAYNNTGDVTYDFKVNGATIQNSSASSVAWVPEAEGTYEISVTVTDSDGDTCTETKTFVVGAASDDPDPTYTEATEATAASAASGATSATESGDTELTSLSRVYFDNSVAGYETVYVYGWGEASINGTYKLTQIEGTDIWYYDFGTEVTEGKFLFRAATDNWDEQSEDVSVADAIDQNANCYKANAGKQTGGEWYYYSPASAETTEQTEATAVTEEPTSAEVTTEATEATTEVTEATTEAMEETSEQEQYYAGDVNLDRTVNVADATLVQKYIVGNEPLSELQLQLADVDLNNSISIVDATLIQKIAVGSYSAD